MRDVTPYVAQGKHVINAAWFGLNASANASANQTALNAAYTALPSTGGVIELPGDTEDFGCTGPWVFNKPVRLIGQGSGYDSTRRPSILTFDASTDGIVLCGLARQCHLSNFVVASPGSGSGVGIRIRGTRPYLENLHVTGFGSHGVFFDTATRTVTDADKVGSDAVVTVAGHGFQIGEQVIMAGFTASTWNGAKIITAITTNTFTFVAGSIAGDATVMGTVYAGNANVGQVINLISRTNGGDGLRTEGGDANVISVYGGDFSSNARGIALYAAKATIIGAHASGNTNTITDGGTTIAVDYYDKGSSNVWINPYSEGSKAFFVDTDDSNDGVLISTLYAAPTVWSGLASAPVANARAAYNANWKITLPGGVENLGFKFIDPAGTFEYRVGSGQSSVDQLQIRDQTNNKAFLSFGLGSTTPRMTSLEGLQWSVGTTTGISIGLGATSKIGLWGTPGVVRPAANADTSGATLGQLETEVNELKALLRSIGALTP